MSEDTKQVSFLCEPTIWRVETSPGKFGWAYFGRIKYEEREVGLAVCKSIHETEAEAIKSLKENFQEACQSSIDKYEKRLEEMEK